MFKNVNSGQVEEEDKPDEPPNDKTQNTDASLSVSRCRKIQSIFQIIYYTYHSGKRKTPLHIMTAQAAHTLGRGGKILTNMLNRTGVSLSYPELRRYQADMAFYTARNNKDSIAIPSNFDPGMFTTRATDNWDHESKNVSEHDTVSVLYQHQPGAHICKPKISDTDIIHGPQSFKDVLHCQKLQLYAKPCRRAEVSNELTIQDEHFSSDHKTVAATTDRAWSFRFE